MIDGYSKIDIQMIMVSTVLTLKDVLEGHLPGKFKERALVEIKRIADSFDKNELINIIRLGFFYECI